MGAWYLDHLLRLRLRRLDEAPHPGGPPIALLGGFELTLGIARAAQLLRAGLEAADLPVHPMDCSAVLRPMPGPAQPRAAAPAGGTMVFCVNPPQMVPLLSHFGPRICRGKRLVGYWWWELDRIPRAWLPWAALMDEIWVSSRFIHDTFSRGLPGKTVRYVPLPVPEPVASSLGRVDFGLPEQPFTVLAPFDLSSHWARKNPMGAIAAFRRAFPSAIEAQLVLKVSGMDQNPAQVEQLRSLTAEMPNVRIIDRTLPPRDLAALVRCADVLLSLHRAEGFGLFIAEAMWLGTAIVATGWSGVMDMLDQDNALLVAFDKVAVRARRLSVGAARRPMGGAGHRPRRRLPEAARGRCRSQEPAPDQGARTGRTPVQPGPVSRGRGRSLAEVARVPKKEAAWRRSGSA